MKRYKFFYDSLCNEPHTCQIEEHPQGEFVRYDDVVNLEMAYKRLQESLKLIVSDYGEDN